MIDGSIRAAIAGCLLVLMAACTAPAPQPNAAPPPPPDPSVRILQLNLCGSGIAGCYTGRSTAAAAAAIRAEQPDLVTLNEVCHEDVAALGQALGTAASAFQPARNGRNGEPYRCRNGQQYGVGVISRWPGSPARGGIYPAQDADDPEERAWLCMDVAAGPPLALCTTHLAYTKRAVAGAQCRHLFDTVIAAIRAPVVMGGDLNLGPGTSPDLVSCIPAGSVLVDDGGEQHVVATPEFVVTASRTIDLHGATDHPGLLVTLARRR